MGDYEKSQDVVAGPDALFDYLCDVGNLPKYMRRMTSAEPGEGEAVQVTAELDLDGETRTVQGEAWFRVDHDARTLAWGSEGLNDYRGELEVSPGTVDGSRVHVRLHTERADDAGAIESDLDDTVEAIRRLVEEEARVPR